MEPIKGEHFRKSVISDRTALIIDTADYFVALREACLKAERHIYILSWDVQSQVELVRGKEVSDGFPTSFKAFLNELAKKRRIQVRLLVWDFAMIYALERDWLTPYEFSWRTHRRFKFMWDSHHPVGASQHQKVVVIDDKVAFMGGIDITSRRWDTSDHKPDNPLRVTPKGEPYIPFHDTQWVVEGEAARALGELARYRWKCATGKKLLKPRRKVKSDPWPESVRSAMTNPKLFMSHTFPSYGDRQATIEIERLYVDAIKDAKDYIYIENQYFTSYKVAEALAESLKQDSGPEIVMLLPKFSGGWLEQATMDVVRHRCLKTVREADHENRFRLYYPDYEGLEPDYIVVHAKLLIADDKFITMGSANLSNRSMRVDSEVNFSLVAENDEQVAFIQDVKVRLFSEHLMRSESEVTHSLVENPSLHKLIDSTKKKARHLVELDGSIPDELEAMVPSSGLLDLEKPLDQTDLAEQFMHDEDREPTKKGALIKLSIVIGLVILAAAWKFSPLGEILDLEALKEYSKEVQGSPSSIPIALAAFSLAGLIAFPITLLIATVMFVFEFWTGFFLSLIGVVISSILGFVLGGWLGKDFVRRFAGSRVSNWSEKLGKQGILSLIFVRIVPVAPFTVTNIVAGASHIKFRDFLIGSTVGIIPGIIGLSIAADRLFALIENPDWSNIMLLVLSLLVFIGAFAFLVKWLKAKQPTNQS